MRLVTYDDGHLHRVGVLQGERIFDLTTLARDMITLIEGGPPLLNQIRELVSGHSDQLSGVHVPLDGVRLLAPIPRPRKNIVCLGKNYAAHVLETARTRGREEKVPDHPVFFTKAVTAVNHPDASIPYDPNISTQIDWEVELAFIIGRKGKNIHRDEAMEYVFGYTILNDLTARDMQSRHRQFYKGKSLDGHAPFGPWIVTADEIPDPHQLRICLRVNGETMQDAITSAMIYPIPEIIAVLSQGTTLEVGDIIATGTPEGVGMAMDPPRFLRPGDVIEAEIESIGVLRNTVG